MATRATPQTEQDLIGRLSTAKILATTTKVQERDQRHRKGLTQLEPLVTTVQAWQEARPPLFEADMDLALLILLLLGEIEEVNEHRQLEGLPGYDLKSEKGETIDVAFFLSSLTTILRLTGEDIDFFMARAKANGQAKGSHALDLLSEVGGNINKKTLQQDLQYLWTLWVSYVIHMKEPVDPNQVLAEYVIPKNNGNYPEELLRGNPLFEREFGRKMNKEEKIAYFSHFRKAMRLIRDFFILYVDPMVEHTGLKPEHYTPYRMFIYTFTRFPGVGLNEVTALTMLEDELYRDNEIVKPAQGELNIARLVLK